MNRREFFRRIVPNLGDSDDSGATQPHSVAQTSKSVRLTEEQRFLRAMALGIDPATVSPGRLEELVPDPEPTSSPMKRERLETED
ncbi:hypothetical protein SAMN02745704_01230 [Paucidesulfovibrio gracilis DSM 16080]|uniref:Uncharacterized protein n=1 Tax=Paucidesulfovibrio gracilis DSM 16080 TaxID=1121449 RepID=A0A1T4WNM1_9BACT|nr:hypothetical protein [Paucidesulfovibrio gracilis]SKA78943.1 hypothetical protein SAMN02745704_01230 [Paucidesulfovibrio gracilis DSM 16080]